MLLRILHVLISLVILAWSAPTALASHLRSVEIEVKRTNCSSLTVEVVVTAYVNYHNTQTLFGGESDYLRFGDGTSVMIPETMHEVFDANLYVGRVRYVTTHTYSEFGLYQISYIEGNRNGGILNFDNSLNHPFYTETAILLEPGICNNSTRLLVPPIDRACSGVAFFHNPGAIDSDGDSLSYQLVVPKKGAGSEVSNYFYPDDAKFYTDAGISYATGNESKDGAPDLTIDPETGAIAWDAPGAPGEYAIAVKITEWKYHVQENYWYEAGYVVRDMQIIVEECANKKPELNIPADICVVAGTNIGFHLPATDPDHHNLVIEAFSEIFDLPEYKANLEPESGALQSTAPPHDTASAAFTWATHCAHVRSHAYKVVFKITDRPPSGPRLARFYTINITVMAPAPEMESVTINPIIKNVSLQWKDYSCENVTAFQVWRRISRFRYDQPECSVGMPHFLRYQLMAELPGTVFNYTDDGLSFGAQYCYRIVALIGGKKTASRVSLDTCFIPKPAEAPVIVNVSAEHTDPLNGQILVRWTKPFDIDPQQYPAPYLYKVWRKNDSDGQSVFEVITPEPIRDTVFTDTGLNTQEDVFRYRIALYVPALTSSPVDTSSEASSVFAETAPLLNGIHIEWSANTPWYNYSEADPYHLIYRAESREGPFILIDRVNVNRNDFSYTDLGQYNNQGLTRDLYYYKVETHGTYGNPKIRSPLVNFSQIASGETLDTIPPCEPIVSVVKNNCLEFKCDGSNYYTRLEWQPDGAGCADDVTAYEVLVKAEDSDIYTSLATVKETAFFHTGITSLNKCYRVISIDRAGNRSDTSAVACNSNCVSFKLPNVITPGVKDDQNDVWSAYTPNNASNEDCPRSIRKVDLRIFSRWGEEIFTTSLTGTETHMLWDGRNLAGEEVSSGIYFYDARVIFDTIDPSVKGQQIKGWVHVIR